VRKVLSVQPECPGDPAVRAIAALLSQEPGVMAGSPLPLGLVREVRLGTTVATNALLEQCGAGVVLLINRGFADLLSIGDLHRPDLFALASQRPNPLRVRVLEVEGRLDAEGFGIGRHGQVDGGFSAGSQSPQGNNLLSKSQTLPGFENLGIGFLETRFWLQGFSGSKKLMSNRFMLCESRLRRCGGV
jgi:hypothetical protein